MASSSSSTTTTTNKPFHTYENVGYDDQTNSHFGSNPMISPANAVTTAIATNNGGGVAITNKTAIESPFPDPLHGKLIYDNYKLLLLISLLFIRIINIVSYYNY